MKIYHIDALVDKIYSVVQSHRLENGGYCRWLWDRNGSRQLGINEYGCADAANILYTIGRFPAYGDPARDELAKSILSLRHPDGSFRERTHHPIHTTAHCLAALELFDAVPQSEEPCEFLAPYRTKEGLYSLLDSLLWVENPWPQSHQGAGVYAAMLLTGAADLEWQNWYFDWLWENTDDEYGMSRTGTIGHRADDRGNRFERPVIDKAAPVCHHLYGWFHYMFNMEHAKRPLRYPEKLIDTCIHLWKNRGLTDAFAHEIGFMEIDWVFAINRASRQTAYRFDEIRECLREFAEEHIAYLNELDPATHDGMNDLHALFGTVCVLAELQRALPGEIITERPLRLVLDRRPFI